MHLEEVDQFKVLEERVEALIHYITSLREENGKLIDKNQNLEKKLNFLSGEIENIDKAKTIARDRVLSLLEKIEGLGI